jgi:hypothetical protein
VQATLTGAHLNEQVYEELRARILTRREHAGSKLSLHASAPAAFSSTTRGECHWAPCPRALDNYGDFAILMAKSPYLGGRMRIATSLLVVACIATMSASAATPPRVRAVEVPRNAVVGSPWRALVSLSRPAGGTLEARGPSTLTARLTRVRRSTRYAGTLRFPTPGTWSVSARVGGRSTRLGTVAVDIARDPLIKDPFAIAVDPTGALIVGQLRAGALLRLENGRATAITDDVSVFHVDASSSHTYVAARDGAVYRLDGSSLTRATPPLDASSVAVDRLGNIYLTVYAGYVKRVAPDGAVTTLAGDGTEGYTGDGGAGTAAKLFHPHSIAIGADGALYIADTENRRIRHVDLTTGRITTFGGDVGVTVSVAAGPDGSIYSADVVRDGAGGGVTRITPDGTTARILSLPEVNGVAVAPDGTVYVNLWETKRILRLDPATRRTVTVARG